MEHTAANVAESSLGRRGNADLRYGGGNLGSSQPEFFANIVTLRRSVLDTFCVTEGRQSGIDSQ